MAERNLKVSCGSIKATKVELWKFGKESGTQAELKQLCIDCQTMLNRMWQMWLIWHTEQGSRERLISDLAAYRAWHDCEDKGKKPSWSVQPMSKELSGKIYHQMAAEFPGSNCRTRELLRNKWEQSVRNRKASSGSLSGWVAVVLGRESMPSFTKPHPIPFDKKNASLSEEDGKQWLTVRLLRDEHSPKSVKPSIVEVSQLMTAKRKAASQRAIIHNIVEGRWDFKGSSVVFDDGKWYASISYEYEQQVAADLQPTNSILLIPGKKVPWLVVCNIDGRRWVQRFGGRGDNVRYARKKLLLERAGRQQSYRWGSSNNKGHGRKVAELPWTKLRDRWKDFTKTYNRGVVKQLVDLAIRHRAGTVIYYQPKEAKRLRTFLARAGNWPNSVMTWDWFQVGTLLANKCQEHGIEFSKKEAATKADASTMPRMQAADKPASKIRRGKKTTTV